MITRIWRGAVHPEDTGAHRVYRENPPPELPGDARRTGRPYRVAECGERKMITRHTFRDSFSGTPSR